MNERTVFFLFGVMYIALGLLTLCWLEDRVELPKLVSESFVIFLACWVLWPVVFLIGVCVWMVRVIRRRRLRTVGRW